MIQRFRYRFLLAALSGMLVPLVDRIGLRGPAGMELVAAFGLPGTLFAAGVLWPLLARDRRPYLRAAALALAGAISYYCAVRTVINWDDGAPPSIGAVIGASIVGVAIVMAAAAAIVPLRVSVAYGVTGLLAAVLGGWAWHECSTSNAYVWAACYATWHALVSAAIHFGSPSTTAGAELTRRIARIAGGTPGPD